MWLNWGHRWGLGEGERMGVGEIGLEGLACSVYVNDLEYNRGRR